MVKVHIPGMAIHGIARVIEAQIKYLPEFGIELVDSIEEADVINTHGADRVDSDVAQPVLNTNHGLYWSRYDWGRNYQEVNCMVIDAMRQAKAHTSPSEWVAQSLRRGGLFYPEVVYHGIDADEWAHDLEPQPYILWNKARADYVSNPKDMNDLAEKLPGVKFVSTIGKPTQNVTLIGEKKFDEMKPIVQQAGLYLATARETFGIGTLEALASGVPVVGWDWGGQSEIILHGETGYLATPGDYDQLADMVRLAMKERSRMSPNCIQDAYERWGWRPRIKQYADIYKRLHTFYNVQSRPMVTVMVTAYHLDQYLPQCLQSVKEQTFEDFECLVIDDALSDSTKEIVRGFSQEDKRFRYLRPEHNLGLPAARNFGQKQAKGLYFRHLDADDWLAPEALAIEVSELSNDNTTWIGYGPMINVDENGQIIKNNDGNPQTWANHEFSWNMQMAHINQIPSCCMFKREVFDRSGGYRPRMRKAEDAHFWCLTTSNGFTARKITNKATMYHRVHKDSKGMIEWREEKTDGDWTAWFPYRFGADSYSRGVSVLEQLRGRIPKPELVPFSVDAPPPQDKQCWDVHDYAYPVVSIIVTVGPGYEKYIQNCLDSIASQTYPDWECIIVNDTGTEWPPNYWDSPLSGFPWAKEVSTHGNHGVSRARNDGFEHAKGELIVWMDVDDIWIPWFLEKMVAMYESNRGIIYSDVLFHEPGKEHEMKPYKEFACENIVNTGMYPGTSVIIPRSVHEKIIEHQGGWDEEIPGMEDWDYQMAAHALTGICAYHLEEPLFVYNYRHDGNREKHKKLVDKIVAYMDKKWAEYRTGEKKVMCGCQSKKINTIPSSLLSSTGMSTLSAQAVEELAQQTVDLVYLGTSPKITYRGKVTNQTYRFGAQAAVRVKRVFVADAKEFLQYQQAGRPLFKVAETSPTLTTDVKQFLAA